MVNKVAEAYLNRDKWDLIKDTRVIHKEEKKVNSIDKWYIVLCYGYFEGI